MTNHRNNGAGYEVEDANVREVVIAGIAIAVGTFLVCLLMWFLFNALKRGEAEAQTINPLANPYQLPPEPRLQVQPYLDLQNLRQHEDDVLNTYGWVDKNGGKVRLPIDRAMDIVVQRGLPVRGGSNATGR